MPAVVCSNCSAVAHLPDHWPHSGFTCSACRAVVAIAPAPEPAPAFGLDDEPRAVRRSKRRASSGGLAESVAGTLIGGCIGVTLFGCLVIVVVFTLFRDW